MEYVYSAMLLHKAGKEVSEDAVKKVLEAAGVKVDSSRIKALVAALSGVNIDEAIEKAAVSAAPVSAAVSEAPKTENNKKEEKKEKAPEADAGAGLGALFG